MNDLILHMGFKLIGSQPNQSFSPFGNIVPGKNIPLFYREVAPLYKGVSRAEFLDRLMERRLPISDMNNSFST